MLMIHSNLPSRLPLEFELIILARGGLLYVNSNRDTTIVAALFRSIVAFLLSTYHEYQ